MINVESQPNVIDFDALLIPISEENPSGASLAYEQIYDDIREARRADDNLAQGDWQHELKVADYRKVIDLATSALTSQTKDLQICAWLSEALIKQYGLVGLRDSLRLMRNLQENFWETCFPEIEDNDQEGRANAIEWLDKNGSQAVRENPITAGEAISFVGYEESKRFDFPEDFSSLDSAQIEKFSELKAEAEQGNRITGDRWRKAKNATRRLFYEELNFVLDECLVEYKELDELNERNFDRNQMPGLNSLKKTLGEIQDLVKKLLQEKREAEPTEEELNAGNEVSEENVSEESEVVISNGVAGTSGPIKSRQDALKRLTEVANFFHKTEPHSPVSHLVKRAVKWGNMPLENLLQELVKDENVLGQIRETLGLSVNSDSSSDSGWSDSSDSTESSSDW
ncbi:MAG: type VI secretion system protein TssA [Pyrinomonadaceae bacterium]|nr:type VI secretion system protein TssA [Pyrinomonadaceae bacterium]